MSIDIYKKEFMVSGFLSDDLTSLKFKHNKMLARLVRPLLGKELEISFQRLIYQRSKAQNRYLWGVAYPCIVAWYKDTQGETVNKDVIHAHTLQEVLGHQIKQENFMGREILTVEGKSTSKLNTKEFCDLVDKLQNYWAEKGCDIPNPKEHNFLTDHIK